MDRFQGKRIDIRKNVPHFLLQTESRRADDAVKKLTGNSPETYLENMGYSFEEVFGLDRSMKAIAALINSHFEGNICWFFEPGIYYSSDSGIENRLDKDTLYFDMAAFRNKIRKDEPELGYEALALKVVNYALEKYFRPHFDDIPQADIAYVSQFKPDRFLNVGDPWQVVNRRLDREGSATLDYESGEEAERDQVRTAGDLVGEVNERLGSDTRINSFSGAMQELYQAWSKIPEGESFDNDWVFGTTDSETGVFTPGIEDLVLVAQEKNEALTGNLGSMEMEQAKAAWVKIQQHLETRRNYYRGLGKDVDIIDYDTSHGLHPIDYLTKILRGVAENQSTGIDVLGYYRDRVYPKIIHKYLEDLADLHIMSATSQREVDPKKKKKYLEKWGKFLEKSGKDPSRYDLLSPDSDFVDLLINFWLQTGIKEIKSLDPKLYNQIFAEESEMVEAAFPVTIKSHDADFIRGMFPLTQEIKDQYDRIIMHWSFSAHMMGDMSKEQLVEEVWPELERLLAPSGAATISPIGHYDMDVATVSESIVEFLNKTGAKWDFKLSPSGELKYDGDNTFANDYVLRIEKAGGPIVA